MFSNLNATTKGMILVIVPVLFELAFVSVLIGMLSTAAREFDQMQRSHTTFLQVQQRMGRALRAGLLLSGVTVETRRERLAELQSICSTMGTPIPKPKVDTSDEKEFSREVSPLLERSDQLLRTFVTRARAIAIEQNSSLINFKPMLPIALETQSLLKDEIKADLRLQEMVPVQLKSTSARLQLLFLGAMLLSGATSFVLARIFTTDIVKRLQLITEYSPLLKKNQPLPAEMSGRDEIAQLDRALHDANRKLIEARRKEIAILENAADVICSLDRNLSFVACGDAAAKTWGYTEQELRGVPLPMLLPAETSASTREVFESLINDPSKQGNIESVLLCGDATEKWMHWTVRWSEVDNRFFCVVRDITNVKAIERLKQSFLSMVSHDLRTPLTSANIAIELLCEPPPAKERLPELSSNALRTARENIDSVITLVNNLLDLDKLESTALDLKPMVLSAKEVCDMVWEDLSYKAHEADVELCKPKGDGAMNADQDRITQAVTKLILNAIENSPCGSSVAIGIRTMDNFVRISVTDQGASIERSEGVLEHDKYRLVASTGVQNRAMSLALAEIKMIVDAHGGQLGVENTETKGNTFWISIPRFEDDEEDL